jgi:hypothetical protein
MIRFCDFNDIDYFKFKIEKKMWRVLPMDVWGYVLKLSDNPITVVNFVMTCKRVWNKLRHHAVLMDWSGLSEREKLERACLKGYVEVVKLLRYNEMKNDGMCWAARGGHLALVEFFMSKGASDWDWGMDGAAIGGHLNLVEFFISKGASDWNWGMNYAAEGGHVNLVELFISKGASDWDWGMEGAAEGGHINLVEFFVSKGASNWDSGMLNAAEGGHLNLVEFFISKGADNIDECIKVAERENHRNVANYLKSIKLK